MTVEFFSVIIPRRSYTVSHQVLEACLMHLHLLLALYHFESVLCLSRIFIQNELLRFVGLAAQFYLRFYMVKLCDPTGW